MDVGLDGMITVVDFVQCNVCFPLGTNWLWSENKIVFFFFELFDEPIPRDDCKKIEFEIKSWYFFMMVVISCVFSVSVAKVSLHLLLDVTSRRIP